jgi:hypothetical protein
VSITHVDPSGPLVGQTEWQADHLGTADGVVPVGGIIMWSGTIATIPATWAFCDGTANSPGPDLRDQFVVGARQDSAGVAKTNIEGSLKVSATQTGASVANHAALTHTNGAVGDHTNLTHDGAVASHPDLTHAALSHPALTVTHADHSVASGSHTHASGADVSVPSGTIAAGAVSYPSHSHASAANASAPAQTIASGVDISIASITGASAAGVSSFATSTNRSGLTALPSHSHAAATGSRPTLPVASTNAVSVPSTTGASGADHSAPSGSVAAATGSRPSTTGSSPAFTLTHADHSLASLAHQAIGTHANLSHAFTPPAGHGSAGTLTHSFTQPDPHAALTHSTVAIVPAYYALAFIQRMS